jgi:hypothetical protein
MMLRRKLFLLLSMLFSLLAPLPTQAADEVVRIGFNVKITRDLNRADVQAALSLWADELSSKFNVPTESLFYDDMDNLRQDFDRGKVNFVIAAGMDFARHFKQNELAEGFRGTLQQDHTLLLLTHRDAGIDDLKKLQGKRISVLKGDELSEVYLETLCLRHFQRPCAKVFSGIETVANSNQLILRLVFGKADVVLSKRNGFETARELNPQVGRVAMELTRFPIKSSYYGLFNSRITPKMRKHSLQRIPNMHQDVRGRQVLEIFKLDRLELVGSDELRPFYELLSEYEALLPVAAGKRSAR